MRLGRREDTDLTTACRATGAAGRSRGAARDKDIGLEKEGQPVEIKVETFLLTLYGTITEEILTVSDDAVP